MSAHQAIPEHPRRYRSTCTACGVRAVKVASPSGPVWVHAPSPKASESRKTTTNMSYDEFCQVAGTPEQFGQALFGPDFKLQGGTQ